MINAIIDTLKLLNKPYPIQKERNKIVIIYFWKFHIIPIVKIANSKFIITDYCDLSHVFTTPSVCGLINHFLRTNKYYLNAKDIAVAIIMSVSAYCNKSRTDYNRIIDFSYYFLTEIKIRVQEDKLLQDLLSARGKDIKIWETEYDRLEIEEIVNSSRKKLFESYFRSFEHKNFSTKVKIWHPGETTNWIDWKPENSIEIGLNTSFAIREGFFLLGFDYDINNRGLSSASNYKGYEYINESPGRERPIWLR